jgi:GntR family transcriptional regulator
MIDIQHDSPVPIAEQITAQIMAHVASGAIKPGARMREYRAFAQEILANPQAVARAYADLEWAGILVKDSDGGLEVAPNAEWISRSRLQDSARQEIRRAVLKALAFGLDAVQIEHAVAAALAAQQQPISPTDLQQAIKKPSHESRHRDSQGIQVLPREKGPRSP